MLGYDCDKLVLHLELSDINRAGIYKHWYILPLLFTWTGMMLLIARASVVAHQYQFHISKNCLRLSLPSTTDVMSQATTRH